MTGTSTGAVHEGERRHQTSDAITTPIHQTATYWFRDSDELRAFQEGRLKRDEYGRYSNPTVRTVERKLAAMEHGEEALLFASGMCATTTAFLALLPRGSHLILTNDCYRRTRQFCDDFLSKMDVRVSIIAPANLEALERAVTKDTVLFFTELPTNPYLRVTDLPAAAKIAHARGVRVVVDSTFATPALHRALDDGADLVVHSATKYLGGHNDLLAGAAIGSGELIATLRKALGVLGGVIAPNDAYLLLRGIKTLDLRMERHNRNAESVARFLEGHAKIRRVYYPGLASHPDYEVAGRLLRGFGGVVTFEVDADYDGTVRFVDRCNIPYIAPSLGGVESLIEMPVLMSYWDQTPQARRRFGITDSLVRYSCGIEDTADLIADLEQALRAV